MTDEHVIDIRRYLDPSPAQEEQGAFGTWGGAGERSRFALPVWRSIYLANGDWGGIVYLDATRDENPDQDPEASSVAASPFFVLDLQTDPARIQASLPHPSRYEKEKPPTLIHTDEGGLAILLGSDSGRVWFLLLQGESGTTEPAGKDLETLLFLAGECSGLLFLRELAGEVSRRD